VREMLAINPLLVNELNNNFETGLHYALKQVSINLKIVETLLKYGSNL
jgi:hypothetical protein